MKTKTGHKFALLSLILGAFTCSILLPLSRASGGNEDRLLKYYHVYIINEMPADGKDVRVHCWSSEDDLGDKLLAKDEAYFFQFQLNLMGTTKFKCEAYWGYVRTIFMGFSTSRDEGRCDFHCWWSLRTEGIFFSRDKVNWNLEYTW